MEQFSKTSNRCKRRRKRVSNIGTMCEFDQNEDTFSVYLMNWNITSSKMVRKNILEGQAIQEKYPGYGSRNSSLKFV